MRWHYQWLVLHEFLPTTVGDAMTDDDPARTGRRFYDWRNDPYIPVEFSVAAYRFGHSQVRPSYRGQLRHERHRRRRSSSSPSIFEPGDPNPADPADLRGGRRAPRRFIDWQTFFDFGDGRVRPNKMIDTTLSSVAVPPAGSADRRPRTRWPPATCCAT